MNDSPKVEAAKVNIVPGMRLETVKLIERLKEGKVGDVLTDEELRDVCRKDCSVTGDGYGYLQTAINHVLSNHGINWKRVPGAGLIKCLNARETIDGAVRTRRGVHRTAKRENRRLASAFDGASDKERTEIGMHVAIHGTLAAMSGTTHVKKLEARADTIEQPDPQKLLEAMLRS